MAVSRGVKLNTLVILLAASGTVALAASGQMVAFLFASLFLLMVVGVPVGFVQAEESKGRLWQLDSQPSITVLGRKGGSTVAVAILHALMEWAKN